MRKLLLVAAALAVASAIGFGLGRRSPPPDPSVAWAQRFVKNPAAVGRVFLEGEALEGVLGVEGIEELCDVTEIRDPETGELVVLPVAHKVRNLKLTLAANKATPVLMHKWFEESVLNKDLQAKDGSIVILDGAEGNEILRYNFYHAWPAKWYVPELDSDTSGMAIEKIEIAVEKVERAN